MSLQVFGFAVVAVAYTALSIALTFRGTRTWHSRGFAFAAAGTAIWALVGLTQVEALIDWAVWLRNAAWLASLLAFMRTDMHRRLFSALAVACGMVGGLDLLFSIHLSQFVADYSWAMHMALAAFGLLLVENAARNSSSDQLWSRKLLYIGLGTVFAFNLLMAVPEAFSHVPSTALSAAQPILFAVIFPLLVVSAVRMPNVALKVHTSRQAVFHSATLVALAVLVEGMAAAAYFVRSHGGTMATALSITLLFSVAAAALTAASSSSLRSRLHLFISENFFNYKYDYRVEWGRFIASLAARDDDNMPLRVLRTLADLMDCPGGALLIRRNGEPVLKPLARWSSKEEIESIDLEAEAIAELEMGAYVRLGENAPRGLGGTWAARFTWAWIAVPLLYRGGLVALAFLQQPRAARRLDWEDDKLLSLVAQQLAIYLVHDEARKDLDDARQLEAFTSRIAFVAHDMKSSVGQLALLAQNMERFGHDEAFRRDTAETIQNVATKLQELLQRLKGNDNDVGPVEKVDLTDFLERFVQTKSRMGIPVALRRPALPPERVEIARSALLSVLEHILSNALEAAPGTLVTIGLDRVGGALRVSVEDSGKGMAPTFLADGFFRPLHTTKNAGFGLGAYQARQTMRALKGDLEIRSTIGVGTVVDLIMPASDPAS